MTFALGGEQQVELRIGDADTTFTGRHRYQLRYGFEQGIISDGDVIAWDAVGTGWDVPIGQSEVHIVAPFELIPARCSVGSIGSTGGCELVEVEPGHLMLATEGLDAGDGVTVRARKRGVEGKRVEVSVDIGGRRILKKKNKDKRKK